MKRSASALLVAAVAATTAVVVTAQPAHAGWQPVGLTRLSWAYLDSADPKAKFVNTSVAPPIGTIADGAGKAHTYRSHA